MIALLFLFFGILLVVLGVDFLEKHSPVAFYVFGLAGYCLFKYASFIQS